MTQRTRQAIMNYWFWKHGLTWRRASRFFFLGMLAFMFSASAASAKEAALVSKELKPAPVKAAVKAAATKAVAPKAVAAETVAAPVKKTRFELPAVDEADEKAEGSTKFARGTVSAKSRFGLAVVYGTDPVKGDLEIWSDYNKSTKISGYKNPAAIEEGDKVEVQYKQLKKAGKKRILLEVRLLEKKPKEETAPASSAPQTAKPASSLPTVKI